MTRWEEIEPLIRKEKEMHPDVAMTRKDFCKKYNIIPYRFEKAVPKDFVWPWDIKKEMAERMRQLRKNRKNNWVKPKEEKYEAVEIAPPPAKQKPQQLIALVGTAQEIGELLRTMTR